MAYVLIAVVAVVVLMGIRKVTHAAQPARTPWGPLLLWAVLLGGGVSIWMLL